MTHKTLEYWLSCNFRLQELFLVAGANAECHATAVPPGVFLFASGRKPVLDAANKAKASKLLADIFTEPDGNASEGTPAESQRLLRQVDLEEGCSHDQAFLSRNVILTR